MAIVTGTMTEIAGARWRLKGRAARMSSKENAPAGTSTNSVVRSGILERRLQIFETNYGRDAGWLIEYQGRSIAVLTDLRFLDMFLDSYRVEPLTRDDEERRALMSSHDFWREGQFTFRNRRFGELAPYAVALGHPDAEARVVMRGLYLPIGDPRAWERMLLWWRGHIRPHKL
jgi:hypothetical protein